MSCPVPASRLAASGLGAETNLSSFFSRGFSSGVLHNNRPVVAWILKPRSTIHAVLPVAVLHIWIGVCLGGALLDSITRVYGAVYISCIFPGPDHPGVTPARSLDRGGSYV